MLYQTTHLTRYKYQEPVSHCLSETRITPRSFSGQQVRETHIEVSPEAAAIEMREDYFGNHVASFSIFEPHRELLIRAVSTVEIVASQRAIRPSEAPWEEVRDCMISSADAADLRASEYVYESPFISSSPELAAYASYSLARGRPLTDAAVELCARVNQDFAYEPKSTSIDTPVLEVLRKRKGVCQDFAHLMIGALRSCGLAARYVSGYLRSGVKIVGSEASHAWVSVYIPRSGWLDLDPTNNVIPSEGHVTLGWGRDYGDVTPVKGVSLGGGAQIVDVEVSVRKVEPQS
jgi:transglutaminase-like putative cysteine protease